MLSVQERGAGACKERNHDEMDFYCLDLMWKFQHLEPEYRSLGWQSCANFLSDFSTKKYGASKSKFFSQSLNGFETYSSAQALIIHMLLFPDFLSRF